MRRNGTPREGASASFTDEWNRLCQRIQRSSGLDFHLYKPEQMQRRVNAYRESIHAATLDELWAVVSASPMQMQTFLDRLTINVSELFRNPEKWEELRQTILPALGAKKKNLTCWSAGCSYGAEAYTLAMILHNYFPGRHRIMATDIDTGALKQAESGVFTNQDIRHVPLPLRQKHFVQARGHQHIDPMLRHYVDFSVQNLLSQAPDEQFDLIICRNVVIYFQESAKGALYDRFLRSLRPGGVLFLGSTERILHATHIGFHSPLPFFYQRPLEVSQLWQNAS